MPLRLRRRTVTLAILALVVFGCTRKNGSHTEPSPAQSSARAAPSKQVSAGHGLYVQYCKLCHAADGTGYAADNAPSLVSQTFLKTATDEFIASGIRMGRPGTAMSPYGKERGGPLDDAQIADIVAFLRSKGPNPIPVPETPLTGDATRGVALYDKNCRECHGFGPNRGTALSLQNSEFLANARPAFLRYAIEHGRPPTPMPAFRGKLSGEEIGDIVTWLASQAPTGPASPPVQNPTVPTDLPVVINPKGAHPNFTLRDDRFVSAEQVKRALDQKQRIVLLDARSPADWIQFRIPGAIPFPYHDKSNIDRVPNDGTWVVAYCACPHHASGDVVDALRKQNYKRTAVLDEGILVWRNLGYPIEGESAGKAPPTPGVPPTGTSATPPK